MQNLEIQTVAMPTQLGLIGCDPARLMSVEEYWVEMFEPLDLLEDPPTEFARASAELVKLCIRNGIAYRPATGSEYPSKFPAWLFREVYPASP